MNENENIFVEFIQVATPAMFRAFCDMMEADGREEFKPLIASCRAYADKMQAEMDCGGDA